MLNIELFISSHMKAWQRIGEYWRTDKRAYEVAREMVCLVGRFDPDDFDSECLRWFG